MAADSRAMGPRATGGRPPLYTAGKGTETDPPPEPPEGTGRCRHLEVSPRDRFGTPDLQDRKIANSCCFSL